MAQTMFSALTVSSIVPIVGLIGFGIMRLVAGNKLTRVDYVCGCYAIMCMTIHFITDPFYLYNDRVRPFHVNETQPHPEQHFECWMAAVRDIWRSVGETDTRIYQDQFQPFFRTFVFAALFGSSFFSFFTFLGYVMTKKWAFAFQIAMSVWQFSGTYSFVWPEYWNGFRNIKNMQTFALIHLPIIIMTIFCFVVAVVRINRGDGFAKVNEGGKFNPKKRQ